MALSQYCWHSLSCATPSQASHTVDILYWIHSQGDRQCGSVITHLFCNVSLVSNSVFTLPLHASVSLRGNMGMVTNQSSNQQIGITPFPAARFMRGSEEMETLAFPSGGLQSGMIYSPVPHFSHIGRGSMRFQFHSLDDEF